MSMIDSDWSELASRALQVQQRAYAPYSEFSVGAAILSLEGNIFGGCNVENASYGLGICAERNAVAAMIASGDKRNASALVASRGAVSPCGACRQVLSEFGSGFPIALLDSETGQIQGTYSIQELLPSAFHQGSLG